MLFSISVNANQRFIDFAVSQAHSKNFRNCDSAIRKVFEHAGGSDIRVNVSQFPNFKDSLTMTSTWGSKGDSVYVNATFVKKGNSCFYNSNAVATFNKSCVAQSQDDSFFKYVTEVGDYVWMQNKGGLNSYLKPLGGSCIVTYEGNGVTKF